MLPWGNPSVDSKTSEMLLITAKYNFNDSYVNETRYILRTVDRKRLILERSMNESTKNMLNETTQPD